MHDTASNLVIFLSGLISVGVGYLFDVPPQLLWIAAIGCCGGMAITRPSHPGWGLLMILGGTMTTGWALPFLAQYWPHIPQKSIAFFTGLILIGMRNQIRENLPGLVSAAFRAGEDAISRAGSFVRKGGDK
jgi:hypothetical protein